MPGMAHNHSAMHHSVVVDVTAAIEASSCQSDCAKAEPVSLARKVVPAVIVVPTVAGVLDTTAKFPLPHLVAASSLDSSPPSAFSAPTASYNVLRI